MIGLIFDTGYGNKYKVTKIRGNRAWVLSLDNRNLTDVSLRAIKEVVAGTHSWRVVYLPPAINPFRQEVMGI